jgi:hypothetical protein
VNESESESERSQERRARGGGKREECRVEMGMEEVKKDAMTDKIKGKRGGGLSTRSKRRQRRQKKTIKKTDG